MGGVVRQTALALSLALLQQQLIQGCSVAHNDDCSSRHYPSSLPVAQPLPLRLSVCSRIRVQEAGEGDDVARAKYLSPTPLSPPSKSPRGADTCGAGACVSVYVTHAPRSDPLLSHSSPDSSSCLPACTYGLTSGRTTPSTDDAGASTKRSGLGTSVRRRILSEATAAAAISSIRGTKATDASVSDEDRHPRSSS